MKVQLERLRLNAGGYTARGQYFGVGQPLYQYRLELPDTFTAHHRYSRDFSEHRCNEADLSAVAHCPECGANVVRQLNDVCEEIRANDRGHAKAIIRAKYPTATFYN